MAQSENKRLGTHYDKARAEARGASHTPEAGFFDVDGETPVEVKTTAETILNPNRKRPGRYQLSAQNHNQLVEAGGKYDFVLRLDSGGEQVRTLGARKVEEIINEQGLKWPKNSKLKLHQKYIHDG